MEQWSILSNVVNYTQCGKHPKNFHNLAIKAVDRKNPKDRHNKVEEERQMIVKFWRHAREIKRRIVRYIQWNSITNVKYLMKTLI